ncbi:sodium:solute symporter [Streptomyces spiroverticillatus]|uniref:Sodium:solute symporter n=1 Tax=Streptomyces finlayi TaxID=67296 RepID=A0A919C9I7_9ACTN|nr:sodium:solute symporter family protein [Streptomyces finlayi]GHA05652.1 sodium:solute symporter [Streptomyces spiroverticillatus]GHC89472.1 sodium:solute symporter [Streptomyces finlayi]
MNTVMVITLLGIVSIAVVGMTGRRAKSKDLGDWTVGKRGFSSVATWFLQAGESFTTFSFLGLAGLAFGGGVAACYALAYLAISIVLQYLTGPRIWRLGRDRGYITQADFFADRFNSPLLGKVVAVVGAVFLLPYLQLQITGLGLIVQLATGSKAGGTLSMVLATGLTVAFVLWSGIRGLARAAYLKDVLMVVALLALLIAVPLSFDGGVGQLFHDVQDQHPTLLGFHGEYDTTFFVTATVISGIGGGLATMAHLWPPVLSARSPQALRRNYVWLPMYQVALAVPVLVGFAGILLLSPDSGSQEILLTLAGHTMPDWLVAVVAVAAASAAMVPSAAIVMGISTLVSRNLLPARTERSRLRANHVCVVVAAALALVLGLTRPDLLGNLLLLTYGGLSQLAPATLAALAKKNLLGTIPALLGIVTGVAVLAWLTFGGTDIGTWDAGLIALAPNLVVTVVAQLVVRRRTAGAERATTRKEAVAA